jgi:hypothetical protein
MVTRTEFERAVRSARSAGERVAFLGALLARASGLGEKLVVVGGSALSVYSGGAYVSEDVDLVGRATELVPVLQRWGFTPREVGHRRYWVHEELGFFLDLIDRPEYVGLSEGTRIEETAFGPVRLSAPEDLILRRLILAKRQRQSEPLDQAVLLWHRFGQDLDDEYLSYHIRFEDIGDMYQEMLRRAERLSGASEK